MREARRSHIEPRVYPWVSMKISRKLILAFLLFAPISYLHESHDPE